MKPHQRRYSVLLFISLALHILFYLLFLLFAKEESKDEVKQTFQVSLRQVPKSEQTPVEESLEQPVPEEKIVKEQPEPPKVENQKTEEIAKKEEAEQEPSPINNADEMSTNNQDKSIQGKVVGGGQISKEQESDPAKKMSVEQSLDSPANLIDKVDVVELKKPEALKQTEEIKKVEQTPEILMSKNEQAILEPKDFIPSYLDPIESDLEAAQKQGQIEPSYLEVLSGLKDDTGESSDEVVVDSIIDLGVPGNILMLADAQMSEVTVPQPFSDKKSKELKLVNKYIKRMSKQVMSYWINPYKGNQILFGIVRFELNTKGYLVNSYVYRESGDKILDISVLDAIRAVRRFKVPENAIITERYYQNLTFTYSSIEQKIELMPFEAESSTKQEN